MTLIYRIFLLLILLMGQAFAQPETADSEATQEQESAALMEGVDRENSELLISDDVNERLEGVWANLHARLLGLVSSLPLVLVAVAIVLVFWLLSWTITRWNAPYRRLTKNVFLQALLKRLTTTVLLLAAFILALEVLDASALLGTILGAAGIFGLAIGFAIRDTVENFIASILLSIRQPFQPRDHIVIEGNEGKVVKLTSRETILMTLDGNHIRIPNATVYKGNILNYSRNSRRAFTFEVGIDTAVDIRAAIDLARTTLRATPGVIPEPAENCLVKTLGESTIILGMSAWTDQNFYDFGKVKSEAIRNIKEAFDAAGLEMPEPIYRIRIKGEGQAVLTGHAEPARTGRRGESPPIDQAADVAKENHIEEEIDREKRNDTEIDLLSDGPGRGQGE
ncbi:mechanosensitive ion channel family protein [Kineobactrum salinum]|uniref:Small-conductance mechanosensitive channel n=1 Tax=Kineobactrum salinum TaxID=2708301 RepID=A0A6C0U2B2_9GAMM|nr:mechanosensitive ion channel family protein [Kineobactrum salinum]QIB65117.1 mechanosensitive ion channel family protein [Kineobactrum salinum]